jgi:hypothetical protein
MVKKCKATPSLRAGAVNLVAAQAAAAAATAVNSNGTGPRGGSSGQPTRVQAAGSPAVREEEPATVPNRRIVVHTRRSRNARPDDDWDALLEGHYQQVERRIQRSTTDRATTPPHVAPEYVERRVATGEAPEPTQTNQQAPPATQRARPRGEAPRAPVGNGNLGGDPASTRGQNWRPAGTPQTHHIDVSTGTVGAESIPSTTQVRPVSRNSARQSSTQSQTTATTSTLTNTPSTEEAAHTIVSTPPRRAAGATSDSGFQAPIMNEYIEPDASVPAPVQLSTLPSPARRSASGTDSNNVRSPARVAQMLRELNERDGLLPRDAMRTVRDSDDDCTRTDGELGASPLIRQLREAVKEQEKYIESLRAFKADRDELMHSVRRARQESVSVSSSGVFNYDASSAEALRQPRAEVHAEIRARDQSFVETLQASGVGLPVRPQRTQAERKDRTSNNQKSTKPQPVVDTLSLPLATAANEVARALAEAEEALSRQEAALQRADRGEVEQDEAETASQAYSEDFEDAD